MRILLSALLCTLAFGNPSHHACRSGKEARAIAELDTHGEAVTHHHVIQTDGTPGWVVLVHMPGKEKGWKCMVDVDTARVRWKEAIRNPHSRVH